jgi:ATP-dependent Clp protease ATP-binding subunit ClpA
MQGDMMNIDLYSDRAKQAIQSAQSLALARRHQQLAPEHLLKVLLEEKDGLSGALIQSAGGRPAQADQAAEALLARTPKVEGGSGQLYMNADSARVFATAEAEGKAAGQGRRRGVPGAKVRRGHAGRARRGGQGATQGPHRRQRLSRRGL